MGRRTIRFARAPHWRAPLGDFPPLQANAGGAQTYGMHAGLDGGTETTGHIQGSLHPRHARQAVKCKRRGGGTHWARE
eukprot:6186472-Pleurochrysis_carterae.AAC.1